MTIPEPPEAETEDPQAQQIDLDDADVSAEPVASALPPGLPPLPPMPPVVAMAPVAPPAPSRGPMFYVGVLVGVLVLSAAVGTAVALSRRHEAPAAAASAPAAAPKVITIGTVEMDDDPDSGP